MPDITITLKFDSYSEAASFLQNGRDPTQKSPPMTIATSGAAERVVAMAASNRVEDGAATNATPTPDHEALRKDTHKAMVAYVGRGDGKSAKTARDRAVAIFGELASECGDNPTMATGTPPVATVLGVDVTSMTMHQGEAPEAQLGRSCWIEFDLTLQNETPQ